MATVLQTSDTTMTLRTVMARLLQQEQINFLLTNGIPRRALTLLAGWFSKIRQPWVRDISIAVWRFNRGNIFG